MTHSFKYDWKVTDVDVTGLSEKDNSKISSPILYVSPCLTKNHSWKVILSWDKKYPNHYGVFLYLADADFSHPVSVKFDLKVENKENSTIFERNFEHTFDKCSGWGDREAVNISDCKKDRINKICVDASLTCGLTKSSKKIFDLFPNVTEISNLKLYDSKLLSDVIIKCGDTDFQVHKAVLVSRSSVFEAMFRNQMTETQNNTIEVENIHPKAMKTFLKMLYTGAGKKTEIIPHELFSDVLDLAEKYDLPDVKAFCEFQMETTVEVSSAISFFILCEKYALYVAKETILKFIKWNIKAVMKHDKDDWKNFINQEPDLVEELFAVVVS